MKSNSKRKPETLSMRDALDGFKSLKIIEVKDSSKDWRNILWNYPLILKKVFVKTIPFSYIFCFLLLTGIFAFFLQSHSFERFLVNISSTQDTYTEGMVGAISSFNPHFLLILQRKNTPA